FHGSAHARRTPQLSGNGTRSLTTHVVEVRTRGSICSRIRSEMSARMIRSTVVHNAAVMMIGRSMALSLLWPTAAHTQWKNPGTENTRSTSMTLVRNSGSVTGAKATVAPTVG